MTKPIEWRRPAKTVPGDLVRLAVRVPQACGGSGCIFELATPADLVAALAAMPLGDRETVLSASWNGIVMRGDYEHMVAERNEATARAEKAEAEITEVRRVLGVRDNEVTASTAAWRMGEITAATKRAEKAERERDEARKERDRVRASLDVVRHDLDGTRQELREAREARDRALDDLKSQVCAAHHASRELELLRTRLIAAETAAAQREEQTRDPLFRAHEATVAAREPREYPLAEGSRIDGDTLVTAGKARVNIRPYLVDGPPTLSMELLDGSAYWVYLADVLALAHRRGLL